MGGLDLPLVIYIALFVLEPARLYLGYYGNLLERVSSLFGFWILTLVLELPGIVILLIWGSVAVQFALNIVLLSFLLGT